MNVDELRTDALRAGLSYAAARVGLETRVPPPDGSGGFRALLTPRGGEEEVLFAVAPADADYLSLSLVLVVDEAFFHERIEEILGVTSRYEVCPSLARDGRLAEGEVYLHLSVRIFGFPPGADVLADAVENLRAAREALGAEFP